MQFDTHRPMQMYMHMQLRKDECRHACQWRTSWMSVERGRLSRALATHVYVNIQVRMRACAVHMHVKVHGCLCVCVYVRIVYLSVMHVRQQATPRDMYMFMHMRM